MGVGWIDDIYNNTQDPWFILSKDDSHNGMIGDVNLDDEGWHGIGSNGFLPATWCGIPWYSNGIHYKALTKIPNQLIGGRNVQFFTLANGGENWIYWTNGDGGATIARQPAPSGDFHCRLRIEAAGIYIDILDEDTTTPDDVAAELKSAAGG